MLGVSTVSIPEVRIDIDTLQLLQLKAESQSTDQSSSSTHTAHFFEKVVHSVKHVTSVATAHLTANITLLLDFLETTSPLARKCMHSNQPRTETLFSCFSCLKIPPCFAVQRLVDGTVTQHQ